VFLVKYEHHLNIKKESYLRNRPWGPMGCVACEVLISFAVLLASQGR
jgi:hypothetical protein